ncbi:hypothetical protein IF1G_05822 [Cordyceps javanica]|uniref:Uncharacterized protein n=1 Tax=Cordyceps javanica TaxID=43265 RepID=A0A545V2R4_9HYPO|nr:hypothetical protein IF1G_05822 [Cordyceps javanica]
MHKPDYQFRWVTGGGGEEPGIWAHFVARRRGQPVRARSARHDRRPSRRMCGKLALGGASLQHPTHPTTHDTPRQANKQASKHIWLQLPHTAKNFVPPNVGPSQPGCASLRIATDHVVSPRHSCFPRFLSAQPCTLLVLFRLTDGSWPTIPLFQRHDLGLAVHCAVRRTELVA